MSSTILADTKAKYSQAPKVAERVDLIQKGKVEAALEGEETGHDQGAEAHVSFSSANAGGGGTNTDGGVMSGIRSFKTWGGDAFDRYSSDVTGYRLQDSQDRQVKTPPWMEHKNVAVDGSILTDEEYGDLWFEKKYAVEFARASARAERHKMNVRLVRNDFAGSMRDFAHHYGLMKDDDTAFQEAEDFAVSQATSYEEEVDIMKRIEKKRKEALDWNHFVDALQGDRPLGLVMTEFQANRRAAYSFDGYLDGWGSLVYQAAVWGGVVGVFHGTAKGLKILMVDAQFLRSAGMGFASFYGAIVFTTAVVWAGCFSVWALAFTAGDNAARAVKLKMYPEEVANQRSTFNYCAGLGVTFSTMGVGPWWALGDIAYGARIATTGAIGGCLLGYVVGNTLHRASSFNLRALEFTPGEMRTYIATMQREQLRYDHLVAKSIKLSEYEDD